MKSIFKARAYFDEIKKQCTYPCQSRYSTNIQASVTFGAIVWDKEVQALKCLDTLPLKKVTWLTQKVIFLCITKI